MEGKRERGTVRERKNCSTEYPVNAQNIPFGQKRKRGRPGATLSSYLRQPTDALVNRKEVDESSSETLSPPLKKRAKESSNLFCN